MISSHNSKVETQLDSIIYQHVKSTENLEKSLSVGSKRRLLSYRKNLVKSRGLEKVGFDDKVRDVILKYALDRNEVESQLSYLNHLTDGEGYRFSRNLKIYNKISHNLKLFLSPDHPSFRWNMNYQATLKELRDKFSKFRLTPLTFTCDDDVREAIPKESTHSGFHYIITGNRKKGENMEGIYKDFEMAKAAAVRDGTFGIPTLCAFRTQASGEYDDDGSQTNSCKHKLRLVLMFDLILIVNELRFSVPFQNIMAEESFYAGGKDATQISTIINANRVKYNNYFSIDYSSFDSTISSWLIEDAFSIIKSAFRIKEEEDNKLFDVMVHDFIHKDFILDKGSLHIDRGVPSGSMWTQIIDTLVNAIVISTYFRAISKESSMIIMGDDNCIFTNADMTIDVLSTYIMKNFGLIVKMDSKTSFGSTKTKQGVKFLARYWRHDGQYRHPNLLLSRLCFPERFRAYNDEVTPEMVVYAFILTYGIGMAKLIHCQKFLSENRISKKYLFEHVDSRYLPGSLAYIREYTRLRTVA